METHRRNKPSDRLGAFERICRIGSATLLALAGGIHPSTTLIQAPATSGCIIAARDMPHTIDPSIRPASQNASASPATVRRHCCNLLHWLVGPLDHWAHVDTADLRLFRFGDAKVLPQ